jgi:hypothetical protein
VLTNRAILSSIGDRMWFNADTDVVRDVTEFGLSSVRVRLLDDYGTVIAERYYSEIRVKVFHRYGFYAEVLYNLENQK